MTESVLAMADTVILAIDIKDVSDTDDENYLYVLNTLIRNGSDTVIRHSAGKYLIVLKNASFSKAKDVINRFELELLLTGDMTKYESTHRVVTLQNPYSEQEYSESVSKAISSLGG